MINGARQFPFPVDWEFRGLRQVQVCARQHGRHPNTTGDFSIASGFQSLFSNSTGSSNTATGTYALSSHYYIVVSPERRESFDFLARVSVVDWALAHDDRGWAAGGRRLHLVYERARGLRLTFPVQSTACLIRE